MMKARIFGLLLFILLALAWIFMVRSGYASSRCTDSVIYVDEIPDQPGRQNAYTVTLAEEIVACQAFMWDQDGGIYHFGFDQYEQCKSGFCVAGMAMGKYENGGNFSFWWELPASASPLKVELYYREFWPWETPQPATQTPSQPVETSVPVIGWLPLIVKPWQSPDITLGPPPDPRLTPKPETLP